jgi:hypothetical protein
MAVVTGALKGVEAWADLAVQISKEVYVPVKTGRLARSIHKDKEGAQEVEPLIFSILFGTNVNYARAHELGSGIHALNPAERELIKIEAGYWTGKSTKKALAFQWPEGPTDHPAYDEESGKFVFRAVYHPGVPAANQGRGYLRPAAKDSMDTGKALVASAIVAELKRTRR